MDIFMDADPAIITAYLKDFVSYAQKFPHAIKNGIGAEELVNELFKGAETLLKYNVAYYDKNGDGPYCPRCYITGDSKMKLVDPPNEQFAFGKKECCHCKLLFSTKEAD
jgi:hypothetical protein